MNYEERLRNLQSRFLDADGTLTLSGEDMDVVRSLIDRRLSDIRSARFQEEERQEQYRREWEQRQREDQGGLGCSGPG